MSAITVIEHQELDSGTASTIEFTSISSAYDDLLLLMSLRFGTGGGGGSDLYMNFNGSSSNYVSRRLNSNGSSLVTGTQGTTSLQLGQSLNTSTAGYFGSYRIYIPQYASSNDKTVLADLVYTTAGSTGLQYLIGGRWDDSAAISSILIDPEASTVLQQYSSITLYGITNGTDGSTGVSP